MILVELTAVVVVCGGVYLIWQGWKGRKTRNTSESLQNAGVIAIVDKRHLGLMSKLENLQSQSSITTDTFVQVKDALDKLTDQKEVHLVLHTMGGSLSAAEAICRRLLLCRDRGIRVVCFVPYFAYSAGCMIAAACDEIQMSESAILGPADAQYGSLLQTNSINSIVQTVEFQLEHSIDRIKAEFYARYVEAKATRERQRKWIEELVQRKHYTEEQGASIYEELFSGKYNHDQVIHPEWAKRIGLPVLIVKEMPEFVDKTLRHNNALA